MQWVVEVHGGVPVSFEIDEDTEEAALETARDLLIEWAQSADLNAVIPL